MFEWAGVSAMLAFLTPKERNVSASFYTFVYCICICTYMQAWSHSSPTVWNSLPQTVISDLTVTTGTFKNRLKSALYGRAFLQ